MKDEGTIMILINRFAFGGAEQLVVDTANELQSRGIDVCVVTLRPEKPHTMIGDLRIPADQIQSIPFRSLFDIRAYIRLIRLLHARQPSAVITHLWFANTAGRIAVLFLRLFTRVPRVITSEDNVYDDVKSRRQFFIDRLLQRVSDTIIAVSPSVQESLRVHGIDQKKVAVILNAIDTKRMTPRADDRVGMRSALDLGEEFVYLFIGRLVSQKGADTLIRSFARMRSGVLLVVGDGIERERLEALASELGCGTRVRFLGARRDLRQLFAAADCFVMPSRWEGFSIVLLQALASGLPIIATDYGSVRAVLRDGVSGLIVPVDDVTELAGAMERMATDTVLRAALKAGAREDVQRFSIEPHVDTLLAYVR